MPYATYDDLVQRYGQDQMLVLADRDGSGQADAEVIARALADADAEIDAYLSARYQLPLSVPQPLLTRLACDIAVYRLCEGDHLATEERRKRFDDALALLRRIRSGEVSIGPQPEPQASTGSAILIAGSRRFKRGSL